MMKILRLHRVEYFVNDVEEAEVNFSKLLNTKFIDHQEQTRPFGSLSLMNIELGTESCSCWYNTCSRPDRAALLDRSTVRTFRWS